MTNPGPNPEGTLGGQGGVGGISAYGDKTEEQYKGEMVGSVTGGVNPIMAFASSVPILGDLVESITGQEDGDYTDLGSFVSLLLGRDASLASRVAAIENKIAVGAEFFENFKRGDNETTLGTQRPVANDDGPAIPAWIQFGDGEPMGIRDQAAQVRRNALPDDGTRYARCPFLATSNDYRVAVVINPNGTPPNPRTSIYGRCNADMTAGIYVDMFGDRTAFGRFTRSGLTMNRTQLAFTSSKRYSNSSTPELRMTGGRYQVVIDDQTILDYTDGSYTPDSTRRTSGFSLSVWTGILAVPQFSPGLASFSVRANAITAVQRAQDTADAAVPTAVAAATTAANTAVTGAVAPVKNQVDSVAATVAQVQEGIPLRPFSHSMTNSEMTFDRTLLLVGSRISRITSNGSPAGGNLPDTGTLALQTGDSSSSSGNASARTTTFTSISNSVYAPPGYTISAGFIRATWSGIRESFTFATGPVSSPCQMRVMVGRMDPASGDITLLWVSDNLTPVVGTGFGEFVVPIPGGIVIENRDTLFVALHQYGSGGVRPLYGVNLSGLPREGALFPSKPNARIGQTGAVTAGTVIAASSLDFSDDTLPWLGIGPSLTVPIPAPTGFYEGFDGGMPAYLVKRSSVPATVSSGVFVFSGTTDGEVNYQFVSKLNRDNHYVEGELAGANSRPSYLGLRSDPNGYERVVMAVTQDTVSIQRRGSSTTTLASSSRASAAGSTFRFAVNGNYFAVYRVEGEVLTELVSYTDSSNVLPRGQTNRYTTIGLDRFFTSNSGGWRWFRASDFPDPE